MRQFVSLITVFLLCGGAAAWSQETPAEIIQRQETEAHLKELRGKIADLEATGQALQKQIDKLEQGLSRLREELVSSRNNNVTAALEDRMKRLVEDIATVDKKRREDNDRLTQYIEKSFAKLEQNLKVARPPQPAPAASGTGTPRSPAGAGPAAPPPGTGKVFEYTVVSGDTLSGILAKIRKEARLNVTQKQVMDVNPNVNWNRLRVGQKIFIPEPKP